MSFLLKVASLVFVLGCLWFSASPVLASGTCVFTCGTGSTATHPPSRPDVADDRACSALCASTPCPTGAACDAVFTADPTPAPSAATRFVCACTCLNPGGGLSAMATSTDSCTHAAEDASAECGTSCTALCRTGTTPPDVRIHPNATLAPTHGAGCTPLVSSTIVLPGAGGGSGSSPSPSPAREAVPLQLSQPIDGVSVVSDFGNYIAVVYRYAIGLAGTATVIMIVYGGFLYLLGSAASDVGKGKQIIQDAIIGLLLVLGAYTILATVNPNTLNLKVPELKVISNVGLPQNAPPPPCSVDTDCPQGLVCLSLNGSRSCQTPLFQNTPGSETHTRCERTAQCPPGQACTSGFCAATSPTAACTSDAECGNGLTCIQGSQCCADATCATPTQATCTVTANCPAGSTCLSHGPRVCRPFERVCGPGATPCPEGYTCGSARPDGPGLCQYVGNVLSTDLGLADLRCSCSCAHPDGGDPRDVASRVSCPSQSPNLESCRASCDATCTDPAIATVPGLVRVPTAPTPCAHPGVTSGTPLFDAPVCHTTADCPSTHLCLIGRYGSGVCVERAR